MCQDFEKQDYEMASFGWLCQRKSSMTVRRTNTKNVHHALKQRAQMEGAIIKILISLHNLLHLS